MLNKLMTSSIIVVTLFVDSCLSSTAKMTNQIFVNKYLNENFDAYKGMALFVRGFNGRNTPIVFLYDYSSGENPCGYIVITVNADSSKVIDSRKVSLTNNCALEITNESKDLTLRFIKYNVNWIRVDTVGNVFVSVLADDKPSGLVRFSDIKYKTEEYKDWRSVKDNWYERKD